MYINYHIVRLLYLPVNIFEFSQKTGISIQINAMYERLYLLDLITSVRYGFTPM